MKTSRSKKNRTAQVIIQADQETYHPDFMDGQPGYFDVTIRNSLQPSYILKAVIRSGAAAKATEFEKDARHEVNVTTAGGLFYPLVLNFWASYHLSL